MARGYRSKVEASSLGPTGNELIRLLAEHRVLEIPVVSLGLNRHRTTVAEALARLESRKLVYSSTDPSDPTVPARWFLTSTGAAVAKALSDDPSWDPRAVARDREEHKTQHDLALAYLRLVIFCQDWRQIVVQRGRTYLRNQTVVWADELFRAALDLHRQNWAAGLESPPPKEPQIRYRSRMVLGLAFEEPIPGEPAVLIPDLYWHGGGDGLPVLVEYEGRRRNWRVIWNKVIHLAGFALDPYSAH